MRTFTLTAKVYRDGAMDFHTQANHACSFPEVREAMIRVRDELNRVLADGPARCPFKNHVGDRQEATRIA
jgi:hypothetical protein